MKCSNCKYFVPDNEETKRNSCRRYPPKIIKLDEDHHYSVFPFVPFPDENWCGEWRCQPKLVRKGNK